MTAAERAAVPAVVAWATCGSLAFSLAAATSPSSQASLVAEFVAGPTPFGRSPTEEND